MTNVISDRDSRMIAKLLVSVAAKLTLLLADQVLIKIQFLPKGVDDYIEEMSDLIVSEVNRQLSIAKGTALNTVKILHRLGPRIPYIAARRTNHLNLSFK